MYRLNSAIVTSARVITGSVRSRQSVRSFTIPPCGASGPNQPSFTENTRISTVPTKNVGAA